MHFKYRSTQPQVQPQRQPRGTIMVVCLVFTTVMMTLMLSFATNIHNNVAAMEYSVANARALELAQAAARLNIERVWLDFNNSATVPTDRIVWLGITSADTNGNRQRDSGEPVPAANLPKYNSQDPNTLQYPVFLKFGQGQAMVTCSLFTPQGSTSPIDPTSQYVYVKFVSTARVAPDGTAPLAILPGQSNPNIYVTVQQLVRFGYIGTSKAFDFAYFVNNYAWMYGNSSQIQIFGNVGGNGNVGLQSGPLIDGYLYAATNASIGATGVVTGGPPTVQTLAQYETFVSQQPSAQQSSYFPTSPAYAGNAQGVGAIPYAPGFSGNTVAQTQQVPLSMPYIGDLTTAKTQAMSPVLNSAGSPVLDAAGNPYTNGKIEQLKSGGNPAHASDWVTVVNGIYGGNAAQNGMYSTVDGGGNVTVNNVPAPGSGGAVQLSASNLAANGNVALIGTAAQPLKITGTVVITNDMVIEGTISGQGTVYTGRNLNIVGDLSYKTPPQWKQNDSSFTADLATQQTADAVGFAVKGSTILGDYYNMPNTNTSATGSNGTTGMYTGANYWNSGGEQYYMKSNFANSTYQSYQTDPTDASIGYYDTRATIGGTANPNYKGFAGDYTAPDGGVRYNGPSTGAATDFSKTVARNYYESSFSDAYIKSIAGLTNADKSTVMPGTMQGFFYTNHLFGGRSHVTSITGSMVARDEAILFDSKLQLFYDPRSSSQSAASSHVNIGLPGGNASFVCWLWEQQPTTTSVMAMP